MTETNLLSNMNLWCQKLFPCIYLPKIAKLYFGYCRRSVRASTTIRGDIFCFSACWRIRARFSAAVFIFKDLSFSNTDSIRVSFIVISSFEDIGIIFSQRRFGQPDGVEFFILESDRGMLFFRRAFLMKDAPDVFGAVGFVEHGFSDGADKGCFPVFIFEG